MKKITLYALSLLVFALTSCEILDETPKSNIEKKNYVKNASQAEAVLLGVYAGLSSQGVYGNNLSVIFPITTDIAQCKDNNNVNFRAVPSNGFDSSNSYIEQTWRHLYQAIYNANDFIEVASKNMNRFPDNDYKLTEIYIGEAKALRALLYFELVRWFGNIVLTTATSDSHKAATDYKQANPVDVYKQIEQDLLDAAKVIPWHNNDNLRGKTAYRLSKGSVYGLLTKVYVTWAGAPIRDNTKWEKAVAAAEVIISSERHSLLADFEDLWRNTCNAVWDPRESLIEISFHNISSGTPAGYIGKFNGVEANAIKGARGSNGGYWKVMYPFMEEWYSHNDPRFGVSIADYKYVGTIKKKLSTVAIEESATKPAEWQICTPAKWDTERYLAKNNVLIDNNMSNINWYVLRYADVLLLYAEALNELNTKPDEALNAVNMVRRRGYNLPVNAPNALCDIAPGLDYAAFKEVVKKERSYELCFEGHRRLDLLRWDVYFQTIIDTSKSLFNWYSDANFVVLRYTIKGKNELMPIPLREIELMKLKQNNLW